MMKIKTDLTRRGFFKASAAAAVASRVAIGPPASAQSTLPTNGGAAEHAPFHRPPDVPPVKYIRHKIPAAKVVEARGEYHEALVPDTCDVEERPRLFLGNFLNSITIPELDDEPYSRGKFELIPARLTLDSASGYVCGMPKYRESLPLLRIMTGSTKGLDIDRTWAENLLKCIGPDGLSYIPLMGRPWDGIEADEWMPKGPDVEFYASLPVGNGRLLGSLANYYRMTGDEVWNQTGKGVVDRLNELAIKVGDSAFFAKFFPVLGEKMSPDGIQKALARMKQPTTGETELNTPMWQTWIIAGFTQYYRVSGYEPAKDLAYRLDRYMRQVRYIEDWSRRYPEGSEPSHFSLSGSRHSSRYGDGPDRR